MQRSVCGGQWFVSAARIGNRYSCLFAALPRWRFHHSHSMAVQFGAVFVLNLPSPLYLGSIGPIEVVAFGLAAGRETALDLVRKRYYNSLHG